MIADVAVGIDVGTSGVRIAALDESGAVRALASSSMPAPFEHAGHVQQDARIWWHATVSAFAALELSGLRIRAVAVDGTSGTILAIRPDGEPSGLASMYADRADEPALARVTAVAPDDTAALGRTSPLARALTIVPAPHALVHQADWIAGRLTGRFDVTDENNALKTGYDAVRRMWPDWIDGTGFDRHRLPHVVPAGTAIGTLRTDIARALALPDEVTVVAGTTDGCAAFLASGAGAPGDGVTSLGTTLTLKLMSNRPVFAPELGVYSHRIGDDWLAGGASNSGGGVLAAFFSPADLERLSPLLQPDVPTGLDYYPLASVGERFPINDAAWPPRLAPRPAEDHRFLQGMLEGIAAIEVRGYRALADLGATPLSSIRTVGGGAANDAWTTIRLNALGVGARRVRSEHAAAGTARLAWRGIGHAC